MKQQSSILTARTTLMECDDSWSFKGCCSACELESGKGNVTRPPALHPSSTHHCNYVMKHHQKEYYHGEADYAHRYSIHCCSYNRSQC
mmetsp:Transcript_33837/g.68843  ORF Transcript_33837/g.68843 Transcript_33837/m.68843 type:complete len:88 (+) Transcript_33837:63-326(+)